MLGAFYQGLILNWGQIDKRYPFQMQKSLVQVHYVNEQNKSKWETIWVGK